MSILITGGSGFIAPHLIRKLCDNHKVYLHSRSGIRPQSTIKINNLISFDGPLELNTLGKIPTDCDCIIHLAGSFSAKLYEELAFDNLITTHTILDFMKIRNIPKIIYISSAAVWGGSLKNTVAEKTPAQPETDFSHTKFSAECLVKNAFQNGDIETAYVLRPNTVYGYGSNSGIIHSLINRASHGLKFQICGDGQQLRQPLYISDLISAIMQCVNFKNRDFNIYGISGPESFSILNIAEKVSKIFNVNFDCEFLLAENNKPKNILLDQSKIISEIAWNPLVSLEQGLKTIYDLSKFNIKHL
jgi:UDP-glucose 4-epimerase